MSTSSTEPGPDAAPIGRQLLAWFVVTLLVFAVAALLALPFGDTLADWMYEQRAPSLLAVPDYVLARWTAATFRRAFSVTVWAAALLVSVGTLAWLRRGTLGRHLASLTGAVGAPGTLAGDGTASRISTLLAVIFTAGSASVAFHVFYHQGYEAPWYPVGEILAGRGDAPFQQRLLMVWVARGARSLVPLSVFEAFFLSQLVACAAAFAATLLWSRRVVEARLATLGPVMLALMLVPTFGYYNFYDLTIVATFAMGMWAIWAGRPGILVAVMVLGTANHEVTLLLVVVLVAVEYDGMPLRRLVAWSTALVACHVGVRLALLAVAPADAAWQAGRLWFDVYRVVEATDSVTASLAVLAPWYLAAALAMPMATPRLRRTTVLIPAVAALTILFGKIDEPRQFDACAPVVVALILTLLSRWLPRPTGTPGAASTAGT